MVLTNEAISQIPGIQKLAEIKESNNGSFDLPTTHKDYNMVRIRISQLTGIEEGKIVANTPQWIQKSEVVEYMKNELKLPITTKRREKGTVTREMRLEQMRDYVQKRRDIQNMAVADAARNEPSRVDTVATFRDYILNSIASLIVGMDNEGKAIFETDAGKVKHDAWRVLTHVTSLSPDQMVKTNGELKLIPWNSLPKESLEIVNRPHTKTNNTADHTHFVWLTANPETAAKFWVGHADNERHIKRMIRDRTNIERIVNSDGSVVYTIKLFSYFIFPSNRNGDYERHRQFRFNGITVGQNNEMMVQIKGATLPCACTVAEYKFFNSKDYGGNTNPTNRELFDYMKAEKEIKYLPEKAINWTILFLDGDSNKRMNFPVDHVGFRINEKGVYSAVEPIAFEDDHKPPALSSSHTAEDIPSDQPNAAAARVSISPVTESIKAPIDSESSRNVPTKSLKLSQAKTTGKPLRGGQSSRKKTTENIKGQTTLTTYTSSATSMPSLDKESMSNGPQLKRAKRELDDESKQIENLEKRISRVERKVNDLFATRELTRPKRVERDVFANHDSVEDWMKEMRARIDRLLSSRQGRKRVDEEDDDDDDDDKCPSDTDESDCDEMYETD